MAKNKTNPVVSYVFDRYLCVSRSITSLFLPSGSLTLTLTLTLTKFRLVCTPLGKNIVGSFFWSYRCLVLKRHYFVICHAHIDCSKRRIDHGRTRTRTSRFRRKWATTSRGGTGKLRVYIFLKEPQNTFLETLRQAQENPTQMLHKICIPTVKCSRPPQRKSIFHTKICRASGVIFCSLSISLV